MLILSHPGICKLVEVIYYYRKELNLAMISDPEGTSCPPAHVIFHASWEMVFLNFNWCLFLAVSFHPAGLMWQPTTLMSQANALPSARRLCCGHTFLMTICPALTLDGIGLCNYSCERKTFLKPAVCLFFIQRSSHKLCVTALP